MKRPLARLLGVAIISGALMMSPTIASANPLDDLSKLNGSSTGADGDFGKSGSNSSDVLKKFEEIRNRAKQANQNEKIRVMVLLKGQPNGVGNKSANLNQVDSFVKELENSGVNLKLRRSFGMLVKGFSAEIRRGDYYKILANPQVLDIKPLKTFHVTMEGPSQLLQATDAHKSYGADGRGTLVSIIDTGIDIHHPDMYIDPDVYKDDAKMKKTEGFTEKVPWGYNFADHNKNVKDCAACSQHGMHVSGIVAAHGSHDGIVADQIGNKHVDGIAPNAQLLAMKVFSSDPDVHGAYEDDLVAAIEKSIELKADVINMSLGADNDLNNTAPIGEARAIQNAVKAGVQVIVAAGNAGRNYSAKGDTDSYDPDFKDDGTIGSPAVYAGSFAVASVDNSKISARAMDLIIDGNKTATTYAPEGKGKIDPTKTYDLVDAGYGQPDDLKGKDLKGKMALIQRGKMSFSQKFENATKAGAIAVMVYNNDGNNWMINMGGIDDFNIPSGGMQAKDAKEAIKALKDGKTVKVRLDEKTVLTEDLDNGGKPSSFTSWGSGNDLEFKPEIAGVGGNIYSTLNHDNGDGYGYMSGTSMATPSIAGVNALMIQAMKAENSPFKNLSQQERAQLIKVALSNTASIITDKNGVPYTPRQIGAGLAQTKSALDSRVYVTVDGKPNVALKAFTGSKSFTMNLHNYGDKSVTYKVDKTCVLNEKNTTHTKTECSSSDDISLDKSEVTIPAGADAQVKATVKVGSGNHWVSGWVKFEDSTHQVPDVHMPYLGFAGDWNAEGIIATDFTTSPITPATCVALTDNPCTWDQLPADTQHEVVSLFSPQLVALDKDGNNIDALPNYINTDEVTKLIPQVVLQRSAKSISAEVLDKDGNVLRKIGTEENVARFTSADFGKKLGGSTLDNLAWDGTIWDVKTGSFKKIPEGEYTYRLSAKLSDDSKPQITDFKINVNNKRPEVQLVSKKKNGADMDVVVKATDDSGEVMVVGKVGNSKEKLEPTKSGDEYTFHVKDFAKAEHLLVIAADNNGNKTLYLVSLDATPWVLQNLSGHINGAGDIDQDGYFHILGIASAGTEQIHLKENGETVKVDNSGSEGDLNQAKPKGFFEIKFKPVPGANTVTLEALDANGKVVATKVLNFVFDITPAEVKVNEPCISYTPGTYKGGKVLDGTVSGTFKDDYGTEFTGHVSEAIPAGDDRKFTFDTKAGTFTGKFAIPEPLKLVHLIINDGANDTVLPITTCGAEPNDLGTIYDPATWNAKKTDFITALTVGKDLEKKGNGEYTFHFKGKFLRKPSSFQIGGYSVQGKTTVTGGMEDIKVGDDLSFEKDLTVKDGLNKFYYEIKENGKLIEASYLRLAVDNGIPKIVLEKPNAQRDGVVYLKKQDKLPIKGAIEDNQFGFNLFIDGNYVADYYSPWDKDSEKRKVEFNYDVNVKENYGIHSFEVQDQNGNYYVRHFPVVVDPVVPTVDLPITANKHYQHDASFKVTASDEFLDKASVKLDGNDYDAKSVDYKLNKDVYEEYNGDKDPGSVLKPITGSDTNAGATTSAVDPKSTGKTATTPAATAKVDSKNPGSKAAMDRYDAAKASSRSGGDPKLQTTPRSLSFDIKNLTPGAHTVQVTAVDMAGNETTKTVSFIVNGELKITGPDSITLDPSQNLKDQIAAAYKAVAAGDDKATLVYNIETISDTLVLHAYDQAGQKVTRTIKVIWKDGKKPDSVDKNGTAHFKRPAMQKPIPAAPPAVKVTDGYLSKTGSDAQTLLLLSMMTLAAGFVLIGAKRKRLS